MAATLSQWVSNMSVCQNLLEGLIKLQISKPNFKYSDLVGL